MYTYSICLCNTNTFASSSPAVDVDVGYIHVTDFARTPALPHLLSLAVMNNGDPVLIPIACRFGELRAVLSWVSGS